VNKHNFNFNIFKILSENEIFTTEELELLNLYTNTFINNSKNLTDTIYKKELERFVIELSWKSSKIEGNTYSLLDTEKLIKDGIESIGHSRDEAIMILNHKNAFNYIIENKNNVNNLLSKKSLEQIHYLLIKDLGVRHGLRKTGVGITGTFYKPISLVSQLEEQIDLFIKCLHNLSNPYAQALIALLCESYLQPFEDGNKRTARLFANSILIAAKLAPLSYRNVDEKVYKESMLIFYEQNSIDSFKKIFIEQYKFSCENYNIFKQNRSKYSNIDAYFVEVFPEDHKKHQHGELDKLEFLHLFSKDRKRRNKGFIELKIN